MNLHHGSLDIESGGRWHNSYSHLPYLSEEGDGGSAANRKCKTINEKDCAMRKVSTKITSIGGSALIEGIMMRGPKRTTVCVRTGGEIYSEDIK